jgi:hypothetical protein
VHALLDAVLAILLIAAPFVLGFSGEATPRNLFLIAGVVWLLVTIGSRYARKERAARPDAARSGAAPAVSGRGTDPAPAPSVGRGDAPSISPAPPAAGGGVAPPRTTTAPGSTPAGGSPSGGGMVGPEFGPLDGGRRPS